MAATVDSCSICLENCRDDRAIHTTMNGVEHIFHARCLSPWFGGQIHATCPNCREPLNERNFQVMANEVIRQKVYGALTRATQVDQVAHALQSSYELADAFSCSARVQYLCAVSTLNAAAQTEMIKANQAVMLSCGHAALIRDLLEHPGHSASPPRQDASDPAMLEQIRLAVASIMHEAGEVEGCLQNGQRAIDAARLQIIRASHVNQLDLLLQLVDQSFQASMDALAFARELQIHSVQSVQAVRNFFQIPLRMGALPTSATHSSAVRMDERIAFDLAHQESIHRAVVRAQAECGIFRQSLQARFDAKNACDDFDHLIQTARNRPREALQICRSGMMGAAQALDRANTSRTVQLQAIDQAVVDCSTQVANATQIAQAQRVENARFYGILAVCSQVGASHASWARTTLRDLIQQAQGMLTLADAAVRLNI